MKALTTEECQKGEYDILNKVDSICKQLNLRYYLVYGTLIGAVRHHGFIPWDDDLDIMMPRRDYKILLDYFEKHSVELYPLKSVFAWPKYEYAMARITDMRYKLIYTHRVPYCDADMGLFIDIYPFDGVGNNYRAAKRTQARARNLRRLYVRAASSSPHDSSNIFLKAFEHLAFKYAKKQGEYYFQNKLLTIIKKYSYADSRYVAPLSWDPDYVFKKEMFEPNKMLMFVNKKYPVPNDYDGFLKVYYDDYMKLPPKEERVATHSYRAYVR